MRVRTVAFAVLLALPWSVATADDVPDPARKDYQAALDLLAKGDAEKAFSAISRAKDKAPQSVDFWDAYVRIWRAAKKPEKTLWDSIIAKRREASPQSPVFDLVLARLETDAAKKQEHYDAALKKDPKSVEARLGIARLHVAAGRDDEAEQAVEAVLAEKPDLVEAAVVKAEVLIGRGQTRAALAFAESVLAKNECPELRFVLADALYRVAAGEKDEALYDKALEAATKAVAGKPDPAAVELLAQLLEHKGKSAEATALLETHFAKTGAPRLGAMLGRSAFAAGKYAAAAKGLAAAAATDVAAAKALVSCHARLGKAKEAREALAALLAKDPSLRLFAAEIELVLGDGAAARRYLEGSTHEDADGVRAIAFGWDGMVAEVTALAGEKAKPGTREAEEWLLAICSARAFARAGPKAVGLRAKMLAADAQAGAAYQPVTPPKSEPSRVAKSVGFMQRYPTYRRSVCGNWFQPSDPVPYPRKEGGKMSIGLAIAGTDDCGPDPQRMFPFNMVEIEQGKPVELKFGFDEEGWAEAETAFAEGCVALVAADAATADTAFGKALEKEPAWARARLFRALAKALAPQGDVAAALPELKKALEDLPEDTEARRIVVALRAAAGEDVDADVQSLAKLDASFAELRIDKL